MVGVETGFAEGCLYGFLYLLGFGLLYGYGDFLVDCGLGHVVARNGYGVHRGDLHAHFAADLGVNVGKVEAYDGGKLVVEVVVGGGCGGFHYFVSADFGLFAGFA